VNAAGAGERIRALSPASASLRGRSPRARHAPTDPCPCGVAGRARHDGAPAVDRRGVGLSGDDRWPTDRLERRQAIVRRRPGAPAHGKPPAFPMRDTATAKPERIPW